jgi:hypothetical protein
MNIMGLIQPKWRFWSGGHPLITRLNKDPALDIDNHGFSSA